jgi:hypothetical protein
MTLAERICEHCAPARRQQAVGPLLGARYPLRDLLERYGGRRVAITGGVELLVPQGCEWHTSDRADGAMPGLRARRRGRRTHVRLRAAGSPRPVAPLSRSRVDVVAGIMCPAHPSYSESG